MLTDDSKLTEVSDYLGSAIDRLLEIKMSLEPLIVKRDPRDPLINKSYDLGGSELVNELPAEMRLVAAFTGKIISNLKITEKDAMFLAEIASLTLSDDLEDAVNYRNWYRRTNGFKNLVIDYDIV